MSSPFTSVLFPADTSGCSFYRMTAPYLTVQSTLPPNEVNLNVTRRFISDPEYFKGVNMCMLQRQVSNSQEVYYNKFLSPLSKSRGMWVVYNIDDVIHKDDIPKYNKAWSVYQDETLMENIKQMLQSSDLVVTTTEYIKSYYHKKFDIPLNKICVIPNYLPHWWMGGYYDINRTMHRFIENKSKPRVGVVSSAPHYDILNQNSGVDDLTHIVDYIRSTTKKYKWVFFGTTPPALKDLVDSGEIEVNHGCDIMTYPFALSKQNLNAIVAPLEDNEFNKCKSNIKLIEGWAMGIPVIAQDLITYSPYTDSLFTTADDLDGKLKELFKNKAGYRAIVEENKLIVDNGNEQSPNGWWLEKNLDEWVKLFKMRSKTVELNLEHFIDTKRNQLVSSLDANTDIKIIT